MALHAGYFLRLKHCVFHLREQGVDLSAEASRSSSKTPQQLLGLGQYQNGTCHAAVTHLHLVCFAYALLTHLRLTGEKGKRKSTRAAAASTSEVQNRLRRLLWRDLVAHLDEQPSGTSFVKELERLLVA